MNRTFAMGDIHGNFKGMMQAFERSGFDKDTDHLIQLGDLVDGFSESFEVVEYLSQLPNATFIRGNHDDVFVTWMEKGKHPFHWSQGAQHTASSYARHAGRDGNVVATWSNAMHPSFRTDLTVLDVPQHHIDLFKGQLPFYIDDKNRGFVHGGFNHPQGLGHEALAIYCWDRDLWEWYSLEVDKGGTNFQCFAHEEVFIGHTPTIILNKTTPLTRGRVTNLDTGGGYLDGKVTIMNIDTHEFWQSDFGSELYPNENPRK